MISVAEALAVVTGGLVPVAVEQVGLEAADGRVLAEDVAARLTQPPCAVSAMDGYAVRGEDARRVPATLRLIGESAAGAPFAGRLTTGTAVRISTGAPLPEGADAIVIQEDTAVDGAAVTVRTPAESGRWIRPAGLDFSAGQVLLRAGQTLTPRDVGLAAAMNVPWLRVRRRPRIAVVATGDEIVWPGEPRGPAQIVGSNSFILAAAIERLGGRTLNLGVARDDEDSLRTLIAGCRGADLLVTTGGASAGDHDLVRKVLTASGLDLGFYRVAMRPGKPLMFGRLGEVPVLGLPGNPVSVGVTVEVFLRPMVAALLGLPPGAGPAPAAVLGRDLAANDLRQDYLRARLSREPGGALVATPFAQQDSAQLVLLCAADCLVVRPPLAPPALAGDPVEIVPLTGGR
ncbi:MAG: gephyrin-like molybdotransferase Glp [Rhodospirillales bacterium]